MMKELLVQKQNLIETKAEIMITNYDLKER